MPYHLKKNEKQPVFQVTKPPDISYKSLLQFFSPHKVVSKIKHIAYSNLVNNSIQDEFVYAGRANNSGRESL